MEGKAISKVARVIAATVVLLFAVAVARAQSSPQSGCALIEKKKHAQYIGYEGFYKSDSTIKFSLHNNTTCGVAVETDDTSRAMSQTRGGGAVLIVGLHYQVQDRKRWRASENGYGWSDSVGTFEIKPGESAVFFVPLSWFKKSYDLTVPFCYSWESDSFVAAGVGGVSHSVYFLRDDLPAELLK
jgi:hypothetical protein